MANPNLSIKKLKRSFKLLAANVSQRKICENLNIGRGVLYKYKKAADEMKLSYYDVGCMNKEELERFVKTVKSVYKKVPTRMKLLYEFISGNIYNLVHNQSMTVKCLHEIYLNEHSDGYKYTQFNKAIRHYLYAHNLNMRDTSLPGSELIIDFADLLWLTDSKSGEMTSVVVMVCILPYSALVYVKAISDKSMESYFNILSDALSFYNGTTYKVKIYNLKRNVRKRNCYEPTYNDAITKWAAYYDINVEQFNRSKFRGNEYIDGIIKQIYNAICSELNGETFYLLESINERIYSLIDIYNSSNGKDRNSIDVFNSEEKEHLATLPCTPFRFCYHKTVKLSSSCHIKIGLHYYSVPYQYVGQQVAVDWDVDYVKISVGNTRIASYPRKISKGFTTIVEHMPPEELEFKLRHGYNSAHFLKWAESIGQNTKVAMELIMKRYQYVVQSYGECHGIITLKRKYGHQKLELACLKLKGSPLISYKLIKNVLEANITGLGLL